MGGVPSCKNRVLLEFARISQSLDGEKGNLCEPVAQLKIEYTI
jgi:hypothetical protein